jgi:hypothetical protein
MKDMPCSPTASTMTEAPTGGSVIPSTAHKDFELKDSGARREFNTGARRDMASNKERPDLISPFAESRVGSWLGKGAEKYGDRNWEKGMPFTVFYASMKRHMMKFAKGWTDEDHLAAIIFNAQAIIHFQELGRTELDDMPHYQEGPPL